MFFDKDPTVVHLDMNIIKPESNYYVSFYIKGNSDHLVGLYVEDTIRIYIGSAPA